MTHSFLEMQQIMDQIGSLSHSDVVALAWRAHDYGLLRWIHSSGHHNERHKSMTVKTGVGIAGLAIRSGRPFKLDDSVPEAERIRAACPMMLAEQLRSAFAFPIQNKDNVIQGVLLIGKRKDYTYTEDDKIRMTDWLSTLMRMLQEEHTIS
ncbi:MAG: nreA1 [Paenibacillus sp.]|nr:nreA1 [Paenibacillus sp.]